MAEDGGAGAPSLEALQAQLAAAQADLANAKARISELNGESKGHRLNADKHRSDAEGAAKARDDAIAEAARVRAEIEAATAAKVKEADERATAATEAARQRAIRADLRIAAKDANATDIGDVLKLLDMSKAKVSADGDVENAAELMAEMKKAKPHLFGAAKTTSNPADPPKPTDKPKSALEMTPDEYKAARERIRRGARV